MMKKLAKTLFSVGCVTLLGGSQICHAEEYKSSEHKAHEKAISQASEQTVEKILELAKAGDAKAQCAIGAILSQQSKLKEALEWFKKSANQGYAEAQHNIGISYYHGFAVKQDYKKAFEWFKKAAENGFVDSQFALGLFYLKGIGTPINSKNADLLQINTTGEAGDLYKDFEKAFYWFKKASNGGHILAHTQTGVLYFLGLGTIQNYPEAARLFEITLKSVPHPDAQYYLGKMYQKGLGVERNPSKASKLMQELLANKLLPQASQRVKNKLAVYFRKNLNFVKTAELMNKNAPDYKIIARLAKEEKYVVDENSELAKGCFELVDCGVFPRYSGTTVGNAINSYFKNVTWRVKMYPNKKIIVEAIGTFQKDFLHFGNTKKSPIGEMAIIKFVIKSDETFGFERVILATQNLDAENFVKTKKKVFSNATLEPLARSVEEIASELRDRELLNEVVGGQFYTTFSMTEFLNEIYNALP
ncbi:tetratricopeptide repeat protein [Lentisphaerota bacterium WC36G]|nr:sel1 repeat family protein [Lentisphaerae bacterium WC36]